MHSVFTDRSRNSNLVSALKSATGPVNLFLLRISAVKSAKGFRCGVFPVSWFCARDSQVSSVRALRFGICPSYRLLLRSSQVNLERLLMSEMEPVILLEPR